MMTTPFPDFSVQADHEFVKPDHRVGPLGDSVPINGDEPTGRARLGRKSGEPSSRKPRAKVIEPPSHDGEFTEPISDFYRTVAMLIMPFDPGCAGVVLQQEENRDSKNYGKDRAQICAEALDAAAKKNAPLRKLLRMLTIGGVWGAVIAAHTPILLAALSHHTPLVERAMDFQARRMEEFLKKESEGGDN